MWMDGESTAQSMRPCSWPTDIVSVQVEVEKNIVSSVDRQTDRQKKKLQAK